MATPLARDSRAAHEFHTVAGGGYFATGIQGPLTGRRADLVLIDDPVKGHAMADSATCRQALWDWYRTELTTRLKPKGRIVVVMTRWHEDDLAGRLLASDDSWRTLILPALAEAGDPLGRVPGAALWPDWHHRIWVPFQALSFDAHVLLDYRYDYVVGLLFVAHIIGVRGLGDLPASEHADPEAALVLLRHVSWLLH
eukprot:gene12435-16574_t